MSAGNRESGIGIGQAGSPSALLASSLTRSPFPIPATRGVRIALCAGEASGDGLGAGVMAALRARFAGGPVTIPAIQFLLGVYGGYFGGAVGLMMLAAWSLVTTADIKALNPSRMMMVTAANTIAVLCFIGLGVVWWPQTLALGVGAIVGGYGGAHIGRRLPAPIVRAVTIAIAVTITIMFFYRGYFRA